MKSTASLFFLALVLGAMFVLLTPRSGGADPGQHYQLGNDSFERYRAPWRERVFHKVGLGCVVGGGGDPDCTGHVGNNYYAIDFNFACGAPIRADASGEVAFRVNDPGYGNILILSHFTGQGSWFAHLAETSPPAADLAQGDFLGSASDTGHAIGCHLHYQANDNFAVPGEPHTAVNVCLSGTCPGTGFDLEHLSDQRWTEHPSNNTGPGYGRPNTYAWLDPGPETTPLSTDINTLVRYFVSENAEIGSAFASIQGTCATNRHWVKSCDGLSYTQNFLSPPYLGLYYPRSVTEGSGGAFVVNMALWNAYGRDCGGGVYTHVVLGKPMSVAAGGKQFFEHGHMQRDDSNFPFITVRVYWDINPTIPGCTFTGLVDWHIGPCYDVTGDGVVDLVNDVFAVAERFGMVESDSDWDDRYDVDRDGQISLFGDIFLVAGQFDMECI